MKQVFSEKTLIPLSLVLTIMLGVYAFARVSLATEVNKKDLDALTQTVKELQTALMVDLRDQSASLSDMRVQVIVMDSKLNSIAEQLKRRR